MAPDAGFHLKLPLIAETLEKFTYLDRTIMRREPGEPLNPARMSKEECEKLRSSIPARVFKPQYQQQPTDDSSGFCSIERIARYAEAPPFEAIIHSWDIALTKDGGDYTVCAKFGLARDPDDQDILYLTGITRMQVELPDVRESMIALDKLEKPAVIVLDGNGIGRGVYQDLWRNGFRHLLPGESMTSSASDNLKVRRFSEGLFNLYDGRVRLPKAMPGLDPLLREIAAFPGGKYDDQVDALSYVAAYRETVIREARRWGLKLGRLRPPPPPHTPPAPPKSRDQELYDRRRQYRY
jgi:phage terminase large subunit-like protein